MGSKPTTHRELLPGTLDMLILKTLTLGPNHGYGIAEHIGRVSREFLTVGEGSLYPALQRLLVNGWVAAEWGLSANNRKARYYGITGAGRKQLAVERKDFQLMLHAIEQVMEAS